MAVFEFDIDEEEKQIVVREDMTDERKELFLQDLMLLEGCPSIVGYKVVKK